MRPSPQLQISKAAAAQLQTILTQHPGKFLRITVLPGGCNGFEYRLNLDEIFLEDDVIFTPNTDGVKVVVDQMSLELIQGAELDYQDELIGAAFKLNNPNAATSCGCGSSFNI
jgi:iron-sulfur cluster insertion protein